MGRKDYRRERLVLNDFSYQDLACADFRDPILFCFDFRGAHLYRAYFSNARLVTCNFSGACLAEVDFQVRSQRTCSFGNAQIDGILLPPEELLGNTACIHNARSPFLRCAIHPLGPCEGCADLEQAS